MFMMREVATERICMCGETRPTFHYLCIWYKTSDIIDRLMYNPKSGVGRLFKDLQNIKNVKGCRDGMPKSMQTR